MENGSTSHPHQDTDSLKESRFQYVAILFVFMITLAWWDDVMIILQSMGVLLSSAYSFFGGMGIHKFAEKVGRRTSIRPLGLSLFLWLIIVFSPTVTFLVYPSMPITLSSFDSTMMIVDYVINLAKILMFVYGFGYALFTYFGWGLIKIVYNSREREFSAGYVFTIYILLLGLVTLNTTIQMAIGTWYPTWIPIVRGMSIMRFLWLPLSALGLIVQWVSVRSVKKLPSISPNVSLTHKIMMTIGTPLLIPPAYLLFLGPLPILFIAFAYPDWIFGIMLLIGLSLVTFPILSYMKCREEIVVQDESEPHSFEPLDFQYPSLSSYESE